ncbi:MAG: bifunctional riboflavin kinase/FAD synthetase [Bacteroidia bacterium]|nr:bifunctional riboflavin kinase/FAD synthetase [Bacteroidia bacterium]
MKIHYTTKNTGILRPVVTVGTFDGVHLGHRAVISALIRIADEVNGEASVLTFWPHPRLVVNADNNVKLLNTLQEKINILEKIGIANLIIVPFTVEFSRLSPQKFVNTYLADDLKVKELVFGYDHFFGYERKGGFDILKQLGDKFDFSVHKEEALTFQNNKISSTQIRKLILKGDIITANNFLGYNYSITGLVKDGYKIGRAIGFPTANIIVPDKEKLIPCNGVYAVKALLNDSLFNGMLNIGYRPTINDVVKDISIEVHFINFDGDLYNKKIEIEFIRRIRDEKKFDSIDELIEQLYKDREIIQRE